MNRKPIFDALRKLLGRGFTPDEAGKLDAANDRAEGGLPATRGGALSQAVSGAAQSGRRVAIRPLALLVALALSACTIGLVPAYDANLAEGLSAAHADALVQFARVEEGSPREDYPEHAEAYAELIGAFGELRSRAATRPIPPLASRLAKTSVFRRVCPATDDPQVCLNATPESIGMVLSTLRTMRTTHRNQGLEPAIVDLFQREYLTAVDQAMTVEAALKR